MSNVFMLDTYEKPLDPVHPGHARLLLKQGKASVWRRFPFTLILKDEVKEPVVQPLRLKLDPGSRTTGIAIVNDASGEVVFAAELTHRGHKVKERLDSRRAVRRNRRARKTRYRKARWQNRRRRQGWLAPSFESRLANVLTWVHRLSRYCPISAISMELVRFDMQMMDNAEISGVKYQQGTLQGYEVREYLLEKWNRQCAYCGKKEVPLEVEHIVPRAKGGTDRVSNLTLACEPCNKAKGTQDITMFLKKKPDVLRHIQALQKGTLKDATAVNSTRWALFERVKATGLPIECGSGGLTKYNRTMRGLEKTHWLDAANVGKSTPDILNGRGIVPLFISATGHGSRQMCRMNKYGFPRTKPKHAKKVQGFQTGDMIKAVVPDGAKKGSYVGKVAIRATGSFNVTTATQTIEGINARHCRIIHRGDGYSYGFGEGASHPSPKKGGPLSSLASRHRVSRGRVL
ncbi:MAG: HNH endonuclease [Ktedonobacteraceae bacterium]|nr:HNH endonuclease [Ktedonobacteraceae bacterium]